MKPLDRSLVVDMPTFAGWPEADIDHMLSLARAARFAKGDNVFEQGAKAEWYFLLLSGHLQVSKLTPDGHQTIVRYVSPGEMFGIAVQITRDTYPATAKAVVDSVALIWPSASWAGLSQRFPSLNASVLASVGVRLNEVQSRMAELTAEAVEQRLARALIRLAQQAGRKTPEGIEIDFPISRQDLAEMTGTTLFTVSRILSAWEEAGLISGGRQKIVLRQTDQLLLLSEGKAR